MMLAKLADAVNQHHLGTESANILAKRLPENGVSQKAGKDEAVVLG